MNYSINNNVIKVELNNKQLLLSIIECMYLVKNAFQLEFNFTDLNDKDTNTRYVRCYLVFNSNEEANDFMFKLIEIVNAKNLYSR